LRREDGQFLDPNIDDGAVAAARVSRGDLDTYAAMQADPNVTRYLLTGRSEACGVF